LDGEYCTRVRFRIRPRIRVTRDDDTIILGPGKADLLDAVARTGSIRAAAGELGMSYMRAWTLIRTMNAAFRSPLVEKVRGGAGQGGAGLTERGERVLALYRQMEVKAETAIARVWEEMRKEM
jgi:molybdate transport system regulatory protein